MLFLCQVKVFDFFKVSHSTKKTFKKSGEVMKSFFKNSNDFITKQDFFYVFLFKLIH